MTPTLVITVIVAYFILLMVIGKITSKGADTDTFFSANRGSSWWIVAFGMVGVTLSGVTFISVPGHVGANSWYYLQFVFGNFLGYLFISTKLLPFYYKMNMISIYQFLSDRMGIKSYKSASILFIISKMVGAAFRLYLVTAVLQLAFFDAIGVPFPVTVILSVMMVWFYTKKGGIKTIVYTDTLQTLFLLLAVVFTIVSISNSMGWSFTGGIKEIFSHPYSKMFDFDFNSNTFFLKQIVAGFCTTVVMDGLGQDMIQKNLTCKNLKESKRNMRWFSTAFVGTVLLFLVLGVMLYIYAEANGIDLPAKTDQLYPLIALNHLNIYVGILFILGIVAAANSSADTALTSLTTSFCIDFLNFETIKDEVKRLKLRNIVHLSFTVLFIVVILVFDSFNNRSVVDTLFRVAGYTYGPLLGIFAFALLTKRGCNDKALPYIVVASPLICGVLAESSEYLFGGYKFGYEVILLNGLITFIGIILFSNKKSSYEM